MRGNVDHYLTQTGEIGFVERVTSSLVYAQGLPGARQDEVVIFDTGEFGRVISLHESQVEVMSFSKTPVRVGSRVARTDSFLELPLGKELLGATVDPLGRAIDPTRPLPPMKESRPLDLLPSGIDTRLRITHPCLTGVTLVDRMIPIGKGQRELVVGDQKTGKSYFLLSSVFTQVKAGAVGVYAIVGKGKIDMKKVEETLREWKVLDRIVLVVSSADDPASLIYLTPYAAMTVAEYFRDKGNDVILILDDLTTHAKIYRELSLLGKRFPGRNSYPGDMFYTHARLLERAGNFSTSLGERSITCFAVAEAPQGDITGYIQTNLMSMTDGHIFFDHVLFSQGRRPAVDPFLSVTRVGRQTQTPLEHEIARELISFLKNAERLHGFVSFGAELGEHIKRTLEKESEIVAFLDQTEATSFPSSVQIVLFGIVWNDLWQGKKRQDIRRMGMALLDEYEKKPDMKRQIDTIVASSDSIRALSALILNFAPKYLGFK